MRPPATVPMKYPAQKDRLRVHSSRQSGVNTEHSLRVIGKSSAGWQMGELGGPSQQATEVPAQRGQRA